MKKRVRKGEKIEEEEGKEIETRVMKIKDDNKGTVDPDSTMRDVCVGADPSVV